MNPNPQDRLAIAADAYSRLQAAQSQVDRLNSYERLTAGMKTDRANWAAAARSARLDLEAALFPGSPGLMLARQVLGPLLGSQS